MPDTSRREATFDFAGRTALVTGAAQGIGYEIAAAFVSAGASVVVVDRNAEQLGAAWSANDGRVLVCQSDVADPASAAGVVTAAEQWTGAVDIVVNNAGITRDGVVWKMADNDWQAVLDVHLTGTFNFTRACVPGMRQRGYGRVVNVTSYTGLHGNIGQSNYAAAKAGIIGFTKAVAKETARFGITVNAISPNATTPMVEAVPADRLAALTASVPQGRFGHPAEMAVAVQFLASREASYITGAIVPIDGGLSM